MSKYHRRKSDAVVQHYEDNTGSFREKIKQIQSKCKHARLLYFICEPIPSLGWHSKDVSRLMCADCRRIETMWTTVDPFKGRWFSTRSADRATTFASVFKKTRIEPNWAAFLENVLPAALR